MTDTSPEAVEAMIERLAIYSGENPLSSWRSQCERESAAMLRALVSERDGDAERYDALNALMNQRSAALAEMQDRALAAEAEAAALREALLVAAEALSQEQFHENIPPENCFLCAALETVTAALKENRDGL